MRGMCVEKKINGLLIERKTVEDSKKFPRQDIW